MPMNNKIEFYYHFWHRSNCARTCSLLWRRYTPGWKM